MNHNFTLLYFTLLYYIQPARPTNRTRTIYQVSVTDDLECSVRLHGILLLGTSQGLLNILIQHVLEYSSAVDYLYIYL